jgi:transcriptional regulator with XRE-family HTH domain
VGDAERFGANVRKARLAIGWTQEELAEHAGLSSVQISRIERGAREVRISTFVRLVRALRVDPSALIVGMDGRKP